MDSRTTVERAQRLKQLHADHKPLVLPTVWDVWSARTAADAGFPALTIGSHPLADSRGADDREGQTFEEVLAAVGPIIAAVDVPVSVDLESGYGQKPADLVAGLIEVGGVG
ncbi:isocitrate lyase/phosphoenolpyruvate mutase family protein, partial [Streptomyces sp. SID7499]|nr:isocitrate lyase/phosphoenolpyruvate mutase family protein [Streptomyces sp. SID7499]